MTEYQERVVAEKTALDDKIAKLSAFAGSSRLALVEEHEQLRLVRQLAIMREYSAILEERIQHFTPP